ncbi:MAG: hypothetical protein JWP63_6808 [Candidatus Solibacter sp.]|nr:hypothetical protein [Candidatus Solibacter sp.]
MTRAVLIFSLNALAPYRPGRWTKFAAYFAITAMVRPYIS